MYRQCRIRCSAVNLAAGETASARSLVLYSTSSLSSYFRIALSELLELLLLSAIVLAGVNALSMLLPY
jgi:hypothetical protein